MVQQFNHAQQLFQIQLTVLETQTVLLPFHASITSFQLVLNANHVPMLYLTVTHAIKLTELTNVSAVMQVGLLMPMPVVQLVAKLLVVPHAEVQPLPVLHA
jgi:hypothetical protein